MPHSRLEGTNEVVFTMAASGADYTNVATWETATTLTLTSGYSKATVSSVSASRVLAGEHIHFTGSGAEGTAIGQDSTRTTLYYAVTSGTPANGDTISTQRGSTEFTCTITTILDTNTGISPVLEIASGTYTLTSGIVIAGASPSNTYRRIVRANAASRHLGVPGAGVVFSTTSAITSITLTENYAQLEDVEVTQAISGASNFHLVNTGGTGQRIVAVLAHGANSGAGVTNGIGTYDGTYVINCIVYGCNGIGIGCGFNVDNYVYNCTVVGTTGFGYDTNGTGAKFRAKNCIGYNCTAGDYDAIAHADCTNNVSSDLTAPAIHDYWREVDITFVESVPGDYRITNDAAVVGMGADLSAVFDDDIAGTTRS